MGNIVPSNLDKYLKEKMYKAGGDDGFMDRIQLLIYPNPIKRWKYIDRPTNYKELQKVTKVFENLEVIDFKKYKVEIDDVDEAPYLRFSKDAQKLYIQWATYLERRLLKGDIRPEIQGHLSKYRSLMPSLALIFHFIDQSVKQPNKIDSKVNLNSIKRAIYWCKYLEGQLYKVYENINIPHLSSANALLDKIDSGKVNEGDTIRDIYRNGWSKLNDAEKVKNAISIHEDHHYVKMIESGTVGNKKMILTINPTYSRKSTDTADTGIEIDSE